MKLLSNFTTKFKRNMSTDELLGLFIILLVAGFIISMIAAWVTHIVVSLGLITAGTVAAGAALLLFGIIVFPVGIIHGLGVWFGAF